MGYFTYLGLFVLYETMKEGRIMSYVSQLFRYEGAIFLVHILARFCGEGKLLMLSIRQGNIFSSEEKGRVKSKSEKKQQTLYWS